jgi:hypothetical protein
LALKSDNGSAFLAGGAAALLAGWGVWPLFSPPRWPRYNGSCEAGIGSMKTRTHHRAARAGRAGQWACDDAEAARLEANQTARPWGPGGPTPQEVWQGRRPIRAEERAAFAATVRRQERQVRQEQGDAAQARLGHAARAALLRAALV